MSVHMSVHLSFHMTVHARVLLAAMTVEGGRTRG
jgi:hypothetical protein